MAAGILTISPQLRDWIANLSTAMRFSQATGFLILLRN